jgi:hypothetical protein
MAEVRSIPLGGVDYAGQPLPPQGQYLVPGDGPGGWAPYAAPQLQAAPGAIAQQAQPGDVAPGPGGWATYAAPPPPEPSREIGGEEAAVRGLVKGATFGLAPALTGLAAASGIPSAATDPTQIDINPMRPIVGAYKLATGGQDIVDIYNKARQDALAVQEQAQQQHPYLFGGGEIGGAVITPTVGLGAATTLGRVGKSILGGATGGGAMAGGEQVSEGASPLDVAKSTAGGVATGGLLGGALGSTIEGVTGIGRKVGSIVRGSRDPEAEALRIVQEGARQGTPVRQKLAADQPALTAGQEAGTPLKIVDISGAPGAARLRSAANLSPEARDIIGEQINSRFRQQADRISLWIRSKFGGFDTAGDVAALKDAARAANAPNYQRAQLVADRLHPQGIWSPTLERLASSEAIPAAMQQAAQRGSNRIVAQGGGGFNPQVAFQNGLLSINRGRGIRTFPDLQLWDLTQRSLRDRAQQLKQSGANDEADALFSLHRQLLSELDKLVPAFAHARGTAAAFFKANDAIEAGANFVRDSSIGEAEAARVLAKMSGPERALFQRGYAGELADQIERIRYQGNVLNSLFVDSPRAVKRTRLALGQSGAEEFEALMRIEGLVDRARTALGNSTTVRQGLEAGLAGAGASAGIETVRSFNPVYLIAGALIYGGRQAAHKIDADVATRVAQMLLSEDPAILKRGLQVAVKTPWIRDALRRSADVGVRQLMDYAGPAGIAGGAAAGAQYLRGSPADVEHRGDQQDQYGQGPGGVQGH